MYKLKLSGVAACRLKLQLPVHATVPADAPRPKLSTGAIAAAVLAVAAVVAWTQLAHT